MSHLPIRVNTLRGDQKIDFDVYIKINDKMVLYLRKGDSFEGPRLERLKSKKLKKMFIQPEDETSYRGYVQRNLDIAYDDSSGKDIGTRSQIIHGQQQNNIDEVFENPEKEEAYQSAKTGAEKYVQFLINNDGAVGAVLKLDANDKSVSHHSVNVSTLSVALARRMNVADPKMIQLMALGALLHDFGHQESGLEISRPLKELMPAELEVYKRHPETGSVRVQDKKHFDQMVLNIIAQHEECIDGSGFPRGLKEKDMDPLIVMVASANAIDRLITYEGVSAADAGKRLMIEKVGKHPLQHIQHLNEVLRAP